jgi:hypothetical protein
MMKRGVLASAVLLLAAGGCEKPNPYKLQGAAPDCPPAPVDMPPPNPGSGSGNGSGSGSGSGNGSSGSGSTGSGTGNQITTELDDRVLDYNEALRTASLKLTGNLPKLDAIYQLADADEEDKPTIYAGLIDAMLASPDFNRTMIENFREMFHLSDPDSFDLPFPTVTFGDAIDDADPDGALNNASRDTAALFAAYLLSTDSNFSQLTTATSQTCPTYNASTGVFTMGECGNATSLTSNSLTPVGVLTDPGALIVYYGNLAMRRNRFIHETFLCRFANDPVAEPANPGEQGATCPPGEVIPAYANVWDMSTISGVCNTTKVTYVDFSAWNDAITCANCHSTWNKRAPMFAKFTELGMYNQNGISHPMTGQQTGFSVFVPIEGVPLATLEDWLPVQPGTGCNSNGTACTNTAFSSQVLDTTKTTLAWRQGFELNATAPGPAMLELGQKMAEDPEVQACMLKRTWNMVMTRGDIVYNDAQVPNKVLSKVRTLDSSATDQIGDPFTPIAEDGTGARDLLAEYADGGFKLKSTLRTMLLSEDFLKF